ncbi:MAG: ThiF family adenylyltransferase, partial [Verrucomicrobiota bacterium]
GLVEFDRVDASNLQRQILYGESDLDRPKIEAAVERLREINPHIELVPFETPLTAENAFEIAEGFDLIIDGTDNFPTRYLSNDLAVLTRKPNVYGSIYRFEGQVSVFAPHLGGPCYRCLFPSPPDPGSVPSCAEGGVLGVLPGIVGSMQANEAIKLILGIGEPLISRLVHFDALRFRFREIKLRRDPDCVICGENPSLTELSDVSFECMSDSTSPDSGLVEIDVHQLKTRLSDGSEFTLIDVREPAEIEICRLPQSMLIPLGELGAKLGDLDHEAEYIIHCKSGGRSLQALKLMDSAGFKNVSHVAGGINAWSREIDPNVALY